MVGDDDQIVEKTDFPATVDFYHGICRFDHGFWRREGVLLSWFSLKWNLSPFELASYTFPHS
jgi:hypothetical protein